MRKVSFVASIAPVFFVVLATGCSSSDDAAHDSTDSGPDAKGGGAVDAKSETTADAPSGDAIIANDATEGSESASEANTDDSGEDAAMDAGADADAQTTDAIAPCTYVVDPTNGDDVAALDGGVPFKTITQALVAATPGCAVNVQPGTYTNAAEGGTGETFPLVVPTGVRLLGDEANKGAGTAPVVITGTLEGNDLPLQGLLEPKEQSVIAGFKISLTSEGAFRATVLLQVDGVLVRNNTFAGSKSNDVIYVASGSGGHAIVGNVVTDNDGVGMAFVGTGTVSKVEGNVVRNNPYIGVELDSPKGDFGGGSAGSAGNNVISCNGIEDFVNYVTDVVPAKNNQWDHVPLTLGDKDGADLFDPAVVKTDPDGGATTIAADAGTGALDTTGATVAANACP